MAEKRPHVMGRIEPVRERQGRSSTERREAPPATPPVAKRAPSAGELDADFERRRALRLQLEQTYSVHNGVYADPARPSVPLFIAEPRKIVAYDTREPTIRAMLDLAQANRWNTIKVTGDKEFQRRVWIEAKARGMEAALHSNRLLQRAYQPSTDDFKIVAKLKEARGLGNRIEATQAPRAGVTPREAAGAGSDVGPRRRRETPQERHERYRTAIAAVDSYLATKGVAAHVREAIRDLARLELMEREAAGRAPRAMVVDPSVPGRTPSAPQPAREPDREPSIGR
jgi:hypothetical protein